MIEGIIVAFVIIELVLHCLFLAKPLVVNSERVRFTVVLRPWSLWSRRRSCSVIVVADSDCGRCGRGGGRGRIG